MTPARRGRGSAREPRRAGRGAWTAAVAAGVQPRAAPGARRRARLPLQPPPTASGSRRRAGGGGRGGPPTTVIAAATPATTTRSSSTATIPKRSGRRRRRRLSQHGRRQDLGASVPMPGVHVDHHDIVFDPTDKNHILIGNDGGLYETYDGDEDVAALHEPAAVAVLSRRTRQRAAVLQRVRRHAGQRHRICGPSRTLNRVGIRTSDWYISRRRRRIPAASRSRGSEHRLRAVAGRRARPRSICGPAEPRRDPAARAERDGLEPARRRSQLRGGEGGRGRSGRRPCGQGARAAGTGTRRSSSARTPRAASTSRGERLYRSDDRGDIWTAISPDLTRNLDPATIQIMGKVWPRGLRRVQPGDDARSARSRPSTNRRCSRG